MIKDKFKVNFTLREGVIVSINSVVDETKPYLEIDKFEDITIGVDKIGVQTRKTSKKKLVKNPLYNEEDSSIPEFIEREYEEDEIYYVLEKQEPSQAFLQKQSKEKNQLEEYQAQKLEERKLELEMKIAHLRNKQPMIKLFGLGSEKTPSLKLLEKYEDELENLK